MSSVAETIMFIFQADAVRLNKGLSDAKRLDQELERSLIDTDSVAEHLGASLVTLAKSAGAALAGIFAATGLHELAVNAAESTNEIRRLAERNNMAVDSYAALRAAVAATGADIEEFQSGLETFAEKVDDPTAKLQELAAQMEGLSHFQALQLGQELGLSPSTIALLEDGTEAFNNLLDAQRELGSVTAEQAEAARQFQLQQSASNLVWESIRRSIGLALLPVLTEALRRFQHLGQWVRENRQTVVLFFAAVATAVTAVFLPAIITATTATLAFLAPWLGVAAIIGGVAAVFALLADDVLAFLDGQDSLIGELSKKWPIIGENVRGLAATVQTLWTLLEGFAEFVVGAFTDGPAAAFQAFRARVTDAVGSLAEQFPAVRAFASFLDQTFSDLGDVTGVRLDDVTAIVSAWLGAMYALFQALGDLITEGPEAAFANLQVRFSAVMDHIIGQFPSVGTAVTTLGETIASAVDIATTAWEALAAVIDSVLSSAGSAVDFLKGSADTVRGWFGVGGEQQQPERIAQGGEPVEQQPLARGDVPLLAPNDGQGPQGYGPAIPEPVAIQVDAGGAQVEQARREPLASVTSNAISNQTNNSRSYTQTIGQLNVHTQAKDGVEVGRDLSSNLGDQMRSAIDQFDDGVMA